ncbi:hypothetical protein Tsubulata_006408 [Turnera subulata]|uniref:Protein kinase domain-containing protein n=1 Tax=Turnera subulata TaxID=218843 RepID=A0A9Q0EZ37_9ROSI|nr:hypothetical protein Tsubulata_006408 [Turnera subulata]
MAVQASDPGSTRPPPTRPTRSPRSQPALPTSTSASSEPSSSGGIRYNSTTSAPTTSSSSSSTFSSRTSLSSLRLSLSQNPHIYDISEIRSATNNFLAKRHSSSTPCWRCTLRNSDTIVFQRKLRPHRTLAPSLPSSLLRHRLALLCRSHHSSVIHLLGACISGDHIYLVYDFVPGSNLANCLRNPRNPAFTALSTWMSRMQVAADLASGLDYVHNKTGLGNFSLVHNRIKSSSVIVTEPSFNAKICHFGTAQLCGEVDDEIDEKIATPSSEEEGIGEKKKKAKAPPPPLTRSDSGGAQFEGARGYMSPEFQASGVGSQKSDVYAFGVVVLELLSGEEPLRYRFDRRTGEFARTSVIDTARAAAEGGTGRVREWVDRRLKDSFPVEVAERMVRVALECVHVDPDVRPDMGRVAGKISKWYIESQIWCDSFLKVSDQISVSLAPR